MDGTAILPMFLIFVFPPLIVFAGGLVLTARRPETRWAFWVAIGIAIGLIGSHFALLWTVVATPLFLWITLALSRARRT
jgi:hypothetical protein